MDTVGGQCLQQIERLFAWEKGNGGRSEKEIQEIREKQEVKEVEEFFAYCEGKKEEALPKSVLGKAIAYALNEKGTEDVFGESSAGAEQQRGRKGNQAICNWEKNWPFCNTAGVWNHQRFYIR